jgi:hypothetical protein
MEMGMRRRFNEEQLWRYGEENRDKRIEHQYLGELALGEQPGAVGRCEFECIARRCCNQDGRKD